jgi:hypothetical protein
LWLTGSGPGWVDPSVAPGSGSSSLSTFKGPLFHDGPVPGDVQQGQLGDCYFCAAIAGLAASKPDAVRALIRDAGDGGAVVTFHEKDPSTGQFRPVEIHVDAELYQGWNGKPLYGHSPGDKDSMELWFALVEKAWATWKGGYGGAVAGVQNQVFEAVLGKNAGWLAVDSQSDPGAVWGTIQATLNAGLPLGAATQSVDDGRYANSGVYADHGYTVLGAEEVNGQKIVTLRNPWGSGEPRGDGVDDGVFKLPLSEFQKLFGQLQFALIG